MGGRVTTLHGIERPAPARPASQRRAAGGAPRRPAVCRGVLLIDMTESRSPSGRRTLGTTQRALFILTGLTLLLMAAYVCVRLGTLIGGGYSVADAVMAGLLLGAELFLCF